MKIFMVRHGQSVANVKKIYAGQSDAPLTEVGKEEAKTLVPFFSEHKMDRVYSSDLSRAHDTQRIAMPGVNAVKTPLLREIDVGSLMGKPLGTKKEELVAEQAIDYRDGESRQDVALRLKKFLSILENDPCESVAIFTHNGILNSMLRIVLGDEIPSRVNRNCGVLVFSFDGEQWHFLPEESLQ